MKFELSHDILAKKVYEKSSQEDKMLRKAESFVKERHAYYLAQGVMLGKQDLEYISPYLATVDITKEEKKFIEKSRKKVTRSEGRKLINNLLFIILPILLALLGWALYHTIQTTNALEKTKEANAIALQKAEEAKEAEQAARVARNRAEKQTQIANEQRRFAIQEGERAKKQARRAGQETKRAEKAATRAKKAEKEAEQAAARAKKAEKEARNLALETLSNQARTLLMAVEAQELEQEANELRIRAEQEAKTARKLAAEAAVQQKIARSLYLASLADNALRLRKGIVAYNLAKLSWNMNKNLVAQKVLFDCQNAYLTEPIIFDKYQEKGVQSYMEQRTIQIDPKLQQKNIQRLGMEFRSQISLDKKFDKAIFSPNKKLIATLFLRRKWIKIRNTENGKIIADIKAAANIKNILFSSNNDCILLVLENNTAELRYVDGILIGTLQHDAPLKSAAFSPKGGKIFITTTSENKKGKLWNEKAELLKEFEVEDANFKIKPHWDGKHILTLGKGKAPSLLNVFTNKKIVYKHGLAGGKGPAKSTNIEAQFSPNGNYIMTTTSNGIVNLWKKDGTKKSEIIINGKLDFAKFSPSGKEIITTSSTSRFAELWSLNGKALGKFYYDGYDPINSVEFSNDGFRVLIGRSRIANLWGVKGRLLYSFDPNEDIASANFSNDNKNVLIAMNNGTLDRWNIVRPEEIISYYDNSANIRPLTKAEELEYEIIPSDYN